MPCRINLSEIELNLRIGCNEAERQELQPIRLCASISNPKLFLASETDRLVDTIDASEVSAFLRDCAQNKEVKTLEKLGALLEFALRERFPTSNLDWEISLSKPRFGWSYVQTWRT